MEKSGSDSAVFFCLGIQRKPELLNMKHSYSIWLVVSAALGLLAPFCWFFVQGLTGGNAHLEWKIGYPLERVTRVIWPSSIWLMATDGSEGTSGAYLIIFISVVANVALYAVLGRGVWLLKCLARAQRSR
jgi:hypothetical protein